LTKTENQKLLIGAETRRNLTVTHVRSPKRTAKQEKKKKNRLFPEARKV
jgi:hypothetical protein